MGRPEIIKGAIFYANQSHLREMGEIVRSAGTWDKYEPKEFDTKYIYLSPSAASEFMSDEVYRLTFMMRVWEKEYGEKFPSKIDIFRSNYQGESIYFAYELK